MKQSIESSSDIILRITVTLLGLWFLYVIRDVIWLFLMGFTAFIVRILIDTDLIENFIWVYFIHLTVLVQWALIIVPFGKWTHFLYRSFAMYFQNVKEFTSDTKK